MTCVNNLDENLVNYSGSAFYSENDENFALIEGPKFNWAIPLSLSIKILYLLKIKYGGMASIKDLKLYFRRSSSQIGSSLTKMENNLFIEKIKIGREISVILTNTGIMHLIGFFTRLPIFIEKFLDFLDVGDDISNFQNLLNILGLVRHKLDLKISHITQKLKYFQMEEDLIPNLSLKQRVFKFLDENPAVSFRELCTEFSNEKTSTLRSYMNGWYNVGIKKLNKKLGVK